MGFAPTNLKLDEVVAYWAEKTPYASALEFVSGGEITTVTWGRLEEYIQGSAEQIRTLLSDGDVVGVVCDESLDFHVLINSLWRCGISVLLISRTWGPEIVKDLLKLTRCEMMFSRRRSDAAYSSAWTVHEFPKLRSPSVPSAAVFNGESDRVAMYATTSGTTDNPKCVAITHRKIRVAYRVCMEVRDFSSVRRAACLYALNGIGVMGICFLLPREVGATTMVLPPFSIDTIKSSWRGVLERSVDFVYLVPAIVRLLNGIKLRLTSGGLMAFCAAAPVAREELLALEELYGLKAYNVYGMTEMTFAVFFGARGPSDTATDSIGFPIGIDARLVDCDGNILEGPAAAELQIRGPMITDGYLGNPVATAQTWADGWIKTGDIAERTADGRFFIRGRVKDVVIRGGVLYYFNELEHYVRRAPGVIEACAFKGRDLPSGDELCLAVYATESVDRQELLDWISRNVGSEKVPNVLIVCKEGLPLNSNGKILRNVLSDRYMKGELM